MKPLKTTLGCFELVTKRCDGACLGFHTTLYCVGRCGSFDVVADCDTEEEARALHAQCMEFLARKPATYEGTCARLDALDGDT